MALPTNLSAKLKAVPMDPVALASDLELAYTLSFAQHSNPHTIQTSLINPSMYTPEISHSLLSNNINSQILMIPHTNSYSKSP